MNCRRTFMDFAIHLKGFDGCFDSILAVQQDQFIFCWIPILFRRLVMQSFCHTAAYPKPVDVQTQHTLPDFIMNRAGVSLR